MFTLAAFLWLILSANAFGENLGVHWSVESLEKVIDPVHRAQLEKSWSHECLSPPQAHVREANLTKVEAELLPLICWRNDTGLQQDVLKSTRKGIPSGVTCKSTQW